MIIKLLNNYLIKIYVKLIDDTKYNLIFNINCHTYLEKRSFVLKINNACCKILKKNKLFKKTV
tara:strand:+ start:122 stop:310 length:189 start_codon:yes stop_codon:yes gene_type:complete